MITKWLLERKIAGNPIWYSNNKECRDFTTDAYYAKGFDSKELAEQYIIDNNLHGWLVTEHGFYY